MIDKYSDPKFDFARFVLEKDKTREETVEVVLNALDLYIKCKITDDEALQTLQWLPESTRVMSWKAYTKSNARSR